MKIPLPNKKVSSGFTFVEAVLVVVVIALIAGFLFPDISRRKRYRSQVNCLNNLKQIGLAFRVWAGDNDDKYPMEVSATNGGSKEFVNTTQAFQHFKVMAAELGQSGKLVVCPNDSSRSPSPDDYGPLFCNSNLSYFINVSATTNSNPAQTVLCGDRNITPIGNRLFATQSNQVILWDASIHTNQGRILYADGSAVEVANSFRSSGEMLAIP